MRNTYKILSRNPEGNRSFLSPRINLSIILKWILEKHRVNMWTGFVWFRIGTSCGFLQTWRKPLFAKMLGNFFASLASICSSIMTVLHEVGVFS
jgi:hypothetical protein